MFDVGCFSLGHVRFKRCVFLYYIFSGVTKTRPRTDFRQVVFSGSRLFHEFVH